MTYRESEVPVTKATGALPRLLAGVERSSKTRFVGPANGIDPKRIPTCEICGRTMTFIGQWDGNLPPAALESDEVIYAFMCHEDACSLDAGIPGHAVPPAHRIVVSRFDPKFETDGPAVEWTSIEEPYPDALHDFLFKGVPRDDMDLELLRVASTTIGATKWGGVPSWVQPPHFGRLKADLRYLAQWSDVAATNDTSTASTNLDIGRVFLLESSRSNVGIDLYYQAR